MSLVIDKNTGKAYWRVGRGEADYDLDLNLEGGLKKSLIRNAGSTDSDLALKHTKGNVLGGWFNRLTSAIITEYQDLDLSDAAGVAFNALSNIGEALPTKEVFDGLIKNLPPKIREITFPRAVVEQLSYVDAASQDIIAKKSVPDALKGFMSEDEETQEELEPIAELDKYFDKFVAINNLQDEFLHDDAKMYVASFSDIMTYLRDTGWDWEIWKAFKRHRSGLVIDGLVYQMPLDNVWDSDSLQTGEFAQALLANLPDEAKDALVDYMKYAVQLQGESTVTDLMNDLADKFARLFVVSASNERGLTKAVKTIEEELEADIIPKF